MTQFAEQADDLDHLSCRHVANENERAWRQERMVQWILEPGRQPAILPDIMVGLVYHWLLTLEESQRLIYYHHLLGVDKGQTAKVVSLKTAEETYCALVESALSSVDLTHEICSNGFDISEFYQLWYDLKSMRIDEFCCRHNADRQSALIMKEYVRHIRA